MRTKTKIWLLVIALTPVVLIALYLWVAMSFSYSQGQRAGVLQRLSLHGWVCKTFEGELAMVTGPGLAPVPWYFTVRDAAVAQQLNQAVGKAVVLHYREHRGLPTTCFGMTSYFVDRVDVR